MVSKKDFEELKKISIDEKVDDFLTEFLGDVEEKQLVKTQEELEEIEDLLKEIEETSEEDVLRALGKKRGKIDLNDFSKQLLELIWSRTSERLIELQSLEYPKFTDISSKKAQLLIEVTNILVQKYEPIDALNDFIDRIEEAKKSIIKTSLIDFYNSLLEIIEAELKKDWSNRLVIIVNILIGMINKKDKKSYIVMLDRIKDKEIPLDILNNLVSALSEISESDVDDATSKIIEDFIEKANSKIDETQYQDVMVARIGDMIEELAIKGEDSLSESIEILEEMEEMALFIPIEKLNPMIINDVQNLINASRKDLQYKSKKEYDTFNKEFKEDLEKIFERKDSDDTYKNITKVLDEFIIMNIAMKLLERGVKSKEVEELEAAEFIPIPKNYAKLKEILTLLGFDVDDSKSTELIEMTITKGEIEHFLIWDKEEKKLYSDENELVTNLKDLLKE